MVERLGASAVATTSAGVAWSLGYGDGQRLPLDKLVRRAKEIVEVVGIPVSVDVEAGYAENPADVVESLAGVFGAGVAGINIEDGTDSADLLAKKIEAIKRWLASEGLDVFVNARTDIYLAGLAPDDLRVAETLRREAIYRRAGADGLFVPCLVNAPEIAAIAGEAALPINVMATAGLPDAKQLATLGARRISAGSGVAQVAWRTAHELIERFMASGDSAAFANAMSFADLQRTFS